jgi:hypothetical protein
MGILLMESVREMSDPPPVSPTREAAEDKKRKGLCKWSEMRPEMQIRETMYENPPTW